MPAKLSSSVALLEIEIRCPECGGLVIWQEHQVTSTCTYCGSLLYFEPHLEHRFYVEPRVRSLEDLRQSLILSKAQKKRAEVMSRYPGDENHEELRMLTVVDEPLAPYLEEFNLRIDIIRASLIYVSYWHFQATLFQCLLAENQHGAREFHLRRSNVDQAVPAYDVEKWNFRDRGLRFKEARLKEVSTEILNSHPHLPFSSDLSSAFDRIIRAHPPVEKGLNYTFKHHSLCDLRKYAVFRPYWLCEFRCEREERVIVDGCFGTVAGYPDAEEFSALSAYKERPHAVSQNPVLKVLSSRCPVCGADTQWGRVEKLHFCINCGRALLLRSGTLQTVPHYFARAQQENSLYIPFWRFRISIQHGKQEYSGLQDYYKLFFADRPLKGKKFSKYLWIPAIEIKRNKRGDQLLAEFISSATGSNPELLEGPLQPYPEAWFGALDVLTASEILNCALPVASGVAPAMHRSANLLRMLKESAIRFQETSLILLPYERRRNDIIVNNKPFSSALLVNE